MQLQDVSTAYDLTTGRGRLRYLADEVLARVTREALPFDIRWWFENGTQTENCGTAACAAGWAARDPVLNLCGLRISGSAPKYDGRWGFAAFERFFELSEEQAEEFFYSPRYSFTPTAADVAARIREYLAKE